MKGRRRTANLRHWRAQAAEERKPAARLERHFLGPPASYRESPVRGNQKLSLGLIAESHVAHSLTKYGIAMSVIPMVMSRMVLETKYGTIIRATPQINGTTALCFRP
jgi:hypothetical protein